VPESAPFQLAGRYQLEERLAAGGFGEVWRASDLTLRRPVAVKLLHAGFARHPETLARFRAEARNAGALTHENIARVYDYGEPPEAPAPFIVMELVEGASLQAVLARGALPPGRVLDIIAQVAAGLDAAHRAGMVHRDIKPGNLLLRHDGILKITDFGISHAAGAAPLTSTGQLMGTPGYLAPERARGGSALPASDLYSLGVVAWECLAGEPPFTGDVLTVTAAHRDRPLPSLPAGVPSGLAGLVHALTAKHLAYRPGSAADVVVRAGQLRAWLAEASSGGAPPEPVPCIAPTLELAAVPGGRPAAAAAAAAAAAPLGRLPGRHRAGRVAAALARTLSPAARTAG
jgi:serine/threonine protein kinase